MERLIVLGTGHAMTLNCYNTCFVIQNNDGDCILVDTGGGNTILRQLRDAGIDLCNIHHLILSHKHTDHVLGLFWIIRELNSLFNSGKYIGELNIYMHDELESDVRQVCNILLPNKFTRWIDERIIFNVVEDRETVKMLNYDIKFLDVYAKKDKQFGFKTILENGKSLVFMGDETYDGKNKKEAENADYFLHEAFCLDSQADIFKPYEKYHSTVKTASEIANNLNVKNLILWHSEDSNLKNRKKLYLHEAQKYFSGKIYIPNDMDIIDLN